MAAILTILLALWAGKSDKLEASAKQGSLVLVAVSEQPALIHFDCEQVARVFVSEPEPLLPPGTMSFAKLFGWWPSEPLFLDE